MHDEGALNLRKTMIKKRKYGETVNIYRKKHPEESNAQFQLMRPAFIRNWKKLLKDPVHTSGMVLMKFCEFTATWLGSKD